MIKRMAIILFALVLIPLSVPVSAADQTLSKMAIHEGLEQISKPMKEKFITTYAAFPASAEKNVETGVQASTDIRVQMTAKADSIGTQAFFCFTDSNGWLNNPDCTTNRSTIYRTKNVELRVGYWNGKQYGWGRLIAGDTVYFQVDLNGDRRVDIGSMCMLCDPGTYTNAYPTSSSSKVAFRVCGANRYSDPLTCTPWW
ncbi:hypothetical protein [Kroppenstedtia eburnea]|uniref:Uncharacterized protein n=1 Tax=Kroppenstedtia eburnea TaxID=714067 RepID=A0A1N7JZ99_9BACL|nr:hypothetical protein [Kroppenstedtia eburnea]QKI83382.1 hypothetical protein GXN75_16120 [Kroppenstedtia eburnea]SIS54586.1 hypothetical protein SAMN05421790_102365 [Kroppenstedtia eburnea]